MPAAHRRAYSKCVAVVGSRTTCAVGEMQRGTLDLLSGTT
jgi:hypothetical protein